MNKKIKVVLFTLTLFSQTLWAQSQITQGVNFFRRNSTSVPIQVDLAIVTDTNEMLGFKSFFKLYGTPLNANAMAIKITGANNSGLTFNVELSFGARQFDYIGPKFSGEVNLTTCLRENGQNIFGQFKSLEEVFRYSHEAADLTQFSTCTFSSPALFSNYETPNGPQPRDTLNDFRMDIFSDHIELSWLAKGQDVVPGKFKAPYLYYSRTNGEITSLAEVRRATLSILQNALMTLQGEVGDKQLPKTVAYIMENREALQAVFKQVENRKLNNLELIELSVSVKNAFHILDQAVGLASNRQIQMSQLLKMTK